MLSQGTLTNKTLSKHVNASKQCALLIRSIFGIVFGVVFKNKKIEFYLTTPHTYSIMKIQKI